MKNNFDSQIHLNYVHTTHMLTEQRDMVNCLLIMYVVKSMKILSNLGFLLSASYHQNKQKHVTNVSDCESRLHIL